MRVHDEILIPLAILLSACGGPPAGAQTPAPAADALERAYIYEVAAEQAAPTPAQEAEPGVVRVSGSAQITVSPDRARVSFAVESRGADAGAAAAQNASAMAAVLAAVRAGGFADLQVETFGYRLNPVYSYGTQDGQRVQRIDGYVAVNNVRATTSAVAQVGDIIDAAIGAGANRIAGLVFLASNTEQARREALRSAVQQARAEARILAESLGYELGPPQEVTGGAQAPTPRPQVEMVQMRAMAQEAMDTPIEASDQIVSATVSITFALGPARR